MWHNLLFWATCLPAVAGAADPALLDLIMPDARVVMWVDVSQASVSRYGLELKDAIDEANPHWQERLTGMSGFDWLANVQELLIASNARPGKAAAPLIAVRGSITPEQVAALESFADGQMEYLGVPMLRSSGRDKMAIAFLDDSHAVMGRSSDVEAAVRRQGSSAGPPPALAKKLDELEGYDLWMISSKPPGPSSATPTAGKDPTGFLQSDGFRAGVRFDAFELFTEVVAPTEKDAAGVERGLRNLFGNYRARLKKLDLEDMDLAVNGRHVVLSVQSPEASGAPGEPRTPAAGRKASAPPVISGGSPAPPMGTIRIQSSAQDMGTVLLPAGKQ